MVKEVDKNNVFGLGFFSRASIAHPAVPPSEAKPKGAEGAAGVFILAKVPGQCQKPKLTVATFETLEKMTCSDPSRAMTT